MSEPTEIPEVEFAPGEREQLEALQAELLGVSASPWQPRTVARAFARTAPPLFRFTLQTWIDLDSLKSPLLQGAFPDDEDSLQAALAAFDHPVEDVTAMTPDEAANLAELMRDAVQRGFSAALRMRPAEGGAAGTGDGFGAFAPVLACLIVQLGFSRADALRTPVEQAFVLIAAHRSNQGWRPAGTPYALRDLENGENGKLKEEI
jgi:hypothetical protein